MKRLYSKRHLSHKRLVLSLYVATIFYSLHYALVLYLGSSFLAQFVNISSVSLIYIVSAAATTFFAFQLSHFLNRFSNYKVALAAGTLELITLILIALTSTPWLAITLFVIQQVLVHIVFVSLNISLSEVSKRNESGSVRGVYFTVLNLGILTAAFFSGLIFKSYDYSGVYMTSALLLLPVMYIIYRYVHSIEEPFYKDISFINTIKKISANKDIRNIITIQFVLECFFAAMVVYTTPYLFEVIGIPTSTVLQVIMPIVLLPFIIFPYELGILADTKLGEKELIFAGVIIAAVFTLLIPFITTANLFVWAAILFMTRVGASFIESMNSVYFYKKIHKDEAGIITLFTTGTRSLALIVVPVVSILLLSLFNMPRYSIFIFVSGLLLVSLRNVSKLRDTL